MTTPSNIGPTTTDGTGVMDTSAIYAGSSIAVTAIVIVVVVVVILIVIVLARLLYITYYISFIDIYRKKHKVNISDSKDCTTGVYYLVEQEVVVYESSKYILNLFTYYIIIVYK